MAGSRTWLRARWKRRNRKTNTFFYSIEISLKWLATICEHIKVPKIYFVLVGRLYTHTSNEVCSSARQWFNFRCKPEIRPFYFETIEKVRTKKMHVMRMSWGILTRSLSWKCMKRTRSSSFRLSWEWDNLFIAIFNESSEWCVMLCLIIICMFFSDGISFVMQKSIKCSLFHSLFIWIHSM